MKIGILTFHRPINYGAFLQAYCLSNVLKEKYKNCDVEIIDYIAPKEHNKIYLDILRDFKYYGMFGFFKSIKKVLIFKKSLKFLTLSKRKMIGTSIKNLFKYIDKTYDILVIGSDAVFNWNQNGFPTAFIPNHNLSIPVLTYAASAHGLDFYNVDFNKIEKCSHAFEKMHFIGVRDSNTENFVKFCNKDLVTYHCCDPTFLFNELPNKSGLFNKEKFKKKYNLFDKKPYIVLMVADNELCKRIAEKYKCNFCIVALFKPSKYADIYIYDVNPFEWAELLNGASIVITSYFHGTLLSLVQNTPVVIIDCANNQDNRYKTKLCDVVDRLKLNDFYLSYNCINQEGFDFEKIFNLIDTMLTGEFSQRIFNSVENEKREFYNFGKEIEKLLLNSGEF